MPRSDLGRLTERQIYEQYVRPQLERQRREREGGGADAPPPDAPQPTMKEVAPGKYRDESDPRGVLWDLPPVAEADRERATSEVNGVAVTGETLLRNLAARGWMKAEDVERVIREKRAREQGASGEEGEAP